jgi:hypothetical protein
VAACTHALPASLLLLLLLCLSLQGAPSSKGCGLVAFATRHAAAAAIDVLCNKYIWAGMRSPMVVKHITSHPDKPYDTGSSSSSTGYPYTSSRTGSSSLAGRGFVTRHYDVPGGYGSSRDSRTYVPGQPLPAAAAGTVRLPQQDVLPRGCAPDAYKLFVGNVPKTCTERELRQVRQRLIHLPQHVYSAALIAPWLVCCCLFVFCGSCRRWGSSW